ncbi:hypothetical protein ACOSP7_009743 [Xanthoceras sorbifolium]
MNKEAGLFLGGLVGEVKEIDSGGGGDCLGKFIRVRILIDVGKLLKRGIRLALGDVDKLASILVCYKRLPNFCYYCGLLGHLLRDCPVNDKGVIDDLKLRFEAWL